MKFVEFFVVLCAVIGSFGDLPPIIPRCRRDHPNMSQCIVNAIKTIQLHFTTGNLGGGFVIPKLDPFYFKELHYNDKNGGLKIDLYDVYCHGASNLKIEKFRANIKELKFDALVTIPVLDLYTKYKMEFNFLGARIKNDGDIFEKHVDAKLVLSFRARRILKNRTEFIKFDPVSVKFDRGTVTQLKISSIFGRNKSLDEVMHALVLSHSNFMFDSVYHVIEAELSKLLTNAADKIVEHATYDEMFPL